MFIDDYILGILYGDGSFIDKHTGSFFFSTTNKEIVKAVIRECNINDIRFSHYTRDYDAGEKENWELLEIVESYDPKLKDYLIDEGFLSPYPQDRIKWNGDFMRGFLESSGTFFSFEQRGNPSFRLVLSGREDDMHYIAERVYEDLGINHSAISPHTQKEREARGVITKSYRLPIQNREGIYKFIKFINGVSVSLYLRDRIDAFLHYHTTTPFNMKRKVFKHYKNAVGFMCRTLDLEIKGTRGGGSGKIKPVYLWEDGEVVQEFKGGWEESYKWVSTIYKAETGFNPPPVENEITTT